MIQTFTRDPEKLVDTQAPYTTDSIAKYFISKSTPGTKQNITNLKLQKLLYYAQGFYFSTKGRKLFNERIYLSSHGPVVKSVFDEYKSFNFNEIDRTINSLTIDINKEDKKFLNKIWNIFKNLNGKQLERFIKKDELLIRRAKLIEPDTEIRVENIGIIFKRNYLNKYLINQLSHT